MGIDKETKPNHVNIVIDDDEEYLNFGKNQAEHWDYGPGKLNFSDSTHSVKVEEYFYNTNENELQLTGEMEGQKGKTFFSITIPLSDIVLIDILHGAIKKFNKLKSTMEALQ